MTTDAPLTDLDARCDDLVTSLAMVPDLDGLIAGVEAYESLLALVQPDDPASASALAVAPVWASLAAVAVEVRKLRQMKEA